jgi:hypothetical protein
MMMGRERMNDLTIRKLNQMLDTLWHVTIQRRLAISGKCIW